MKYVFCLVTAAASLLCFVYISTYLKFDRKIFMLTQTINNIYNDLEDRRRYEMEKEELRDLRNNLAKYECHTMSERVNLAQDTLGGRVIGVSGELMSSPKCHFSIVRDFFGMYCCPACKILTSGPVASGDCVAFRGTRASFLIKLHGLAHIEAVSIEHIDATQSPSGEISSAPRDFSLVGVLQYGKEIFLDSFSYTLPGEALQVFKLSQPTARAFNTVKITFATNHGNPEFTCVYRVKVHGQIASKGDEY